MGYVCVFALKIDFLCSKSWYGARRDFKIINNAFILETVSSEKKEAVCRILRFWLIMKI